MTTDSQIKRGTGEGNGGGGGGGGGGAPIVTTMKTVLGEPEEIFAGNLVSANADLYVAVVDSALAPVIILPGRCRYSIRGNLPRLR